MHLHSILVDINDKATKEICVTKFTVVIQVLHQPDFPVPAEKGLWEQFLPLMSFIHFLERVRIVCLCLPSVDEQTPGAYAAAAACVPIQAVWLQSCWRDGGVPSCRRPHGALMALFLGSSPGPSTALHY